MTTVRQLYDLQELDLEIDRSQAEMASIDERLRDDSAVVEARAAIAEREETIQQMRRQHVRRSQEASELQERVAALERRLYGGSVRSPREMEAAQSELGSVKEQVEAVEEEVLNLMIGLDENEEWLARSRTELEEMEQAWTNTKTQLTEERAVLEERLQGLGEQRQQLAVGISAPLLTQYGQLRQARQGHAVATVERGMCTGCRLTLPTGELQRVRAARELVTCSSCGRILFVS